MIELKVKTRKGINAKGKPRIYLSLHRNDFHLFDEITEEILEKQNCAIYYNDDFNKNIDFQFEIGQMQLFVMAVTEDYLNDDLSEFNIAKENNIPILPLMYGRNLENKFNERCGNLQFLDKFNYDETAISYDIKLNKFLSSILISDELANQIRNAFDKHIFLSYRKKDREYANQLMKTIHKNDFFRDIAIWYDEFLTPGEDFNNEIENALKNSDLFALAVTPNLINEPNYVMNVEYIKAKEVKKNILPVEMVETDEKILKEKFKNIPEIINVKEQRKLEKMLKENFKKVALTKTEDAEHNYYIALAYLYGIDVEIDHKKGYEILRELADGGFIDAMEKLADMYRYGDCIEANKCEEEELRRDIIDSYKILVKKDDWLMPELAKAYNNLGIIKNEDYNFFEASKLFSKAVKIISKYGLDTYEAKLDYILYYSNLACSYFKLQKYKLAEKYTFHQIELINELKKKIKFSDLHLIDAYTNLSKIYVEYEKYDLAELYIFKYLKLEKKYIQSSKKPKYDKLIDAYRTLAKIYTETTRYSDALKYCNKALKLSENIINLQYKNNVTSAIYTNLAKIYSKLNNNKKEEEFYLKSLDLIEDCIKNANKYNIPEKRNLSTALNNLVVLYVKQEKYNQALKYATQAFDLFINLMKFDLSYYEYEPSFFNLLICMAECYIKKEDLQKANEYVNYASEMLEAFYDEEEILNKFEVLKLTEQINFLKNKKEEAEKNYIERINILTQLLPSKKLDLNLKIVSCIDTVLFYDRVDHFEVVITAIKNCLTYFIKNITKPKNICNELMEFIYYITDYTSYFGYDVYSLINKLQKVLIKHYYLNSNYEYLFDSIMETYFLMLQFYKVDMIDRKKFALKIINFYNNSKSTKKDEYKDIIKTLVDFCNKIQG